MVPLELEYIGTRGQRLSGKLLKPFLWTNTTQPHSVAKRSLAKRTAPAANNDWWAGEKFSRALQAAARGWKQSSPPPARHRNRVQWLSCTRKARCPTPVEDQGAPVGHPEADSDAEDLAGGLPFENLQGGEELIGEGFAEGEGGGVIAEAETLGSEPEDNYTLQFLRADTVLLKPGENAVRLRRYLHAF